jgi:hypothetical protein
MSAFGACSLCWLALGPLAANALAQKAPARCTAVNGVLLTPTDKGQWTSVAANGDVPSDKLLVALFGADFSSSDGGVTARVVADVGQRGPFAVLEAALRFHPTKADLDVSLERGIMVLTNAKESGPARIRLRHLAETFDIELAAPKARVGIEVYGRHVSGPAKLDNPKEDTPVTNIVIFALQGEVVVTAEKESTRLKAPPGPALYLWDNSTRSADIIRFETLPDSAKPMNDKERKAFEAIGAFAKSWAAQKGDLAKTLEQAASAQDTLERKAAVVALGAVDDLPGLLKALSNKDHADTRDMAVLALRHWLGREPGQSVRLYEHLTKSASLTPIQAKNMLHLLHGIEQERRRQPATYDLLITALDHGKIAARHLAHWHLVRLAPDGKSIAYDAAAPEADRRAAIAEWRRLIPEGQVPPLPKKKMPN